MLQIPLEQYTETSVLFNDRNNAGNISHVGGFFGSILLNKQFTYFDRKTFLIEAMCPFVAETLIAYYLEQFDDWEDNFIRMYLKSRHTDNAIFGKLVERILIKSIKRRREFNFNILNEKDRQGLIEIEHKFIVDNIQNIRNYSDIFRPCFEDDAIVTQSAQFLYVPMIPNFPFVDFVILDNGKRACHFFQISLEITRHRPSATDFAKQEMEIFREKGIQVFHFYYVGVGDKIPDKEISLLSGYNSIQIVPLQFIFGSQMREITKSLRWATFIEMHPLKSLYHSLEVIYQKQKNDVVTKEFSLASFQFKANELTTSMPASASIPSSSTSIRSTKRLKTRRKRL